MILPFLLLLPLAWSGVQVHTRPPQGAADAWAPRRVAVLVGVDTYDDPSLSDLRFAAKDAIDMATVLQDERHGAFDQVYALTGLVSRDDILDALEGAAATLQRDDTFLLYFAGHGTLDVAFEGTRLYLLPSEATLDRAPVAGLPLDGLEHLLEELPARRRVLVVGACWAGTGRSGLSPSTRDLVDRLRGPVPPPATEDVSGLDVHLFAAHHNQPAVEDAMLGNGVYTHYLVDALAGAGDLDGDGLVDAMEAHEYARDRTMSHTGGIQVPWIRSTLVGRNAVYLSGDPGRRTRAERALLVGLQDLPFEAALLVDGQTRGGGALPAGLHDIQVTTGDRTLLSSRIHFQPGDRLDVADLVKEREAAVEVRVGAEARIGSDAVPPTATLVRVTRWPADHDGGRPLVGLSATWGVGLVHQEWRFPTGDFQGHLGWSWGRIPSASETRGRWDLKFHAGPDLGLGVLWRVPGGERQAGPIVTPGIEMGASVRRVSLTLDAGTRLFGMDRVQRVVPGASVAIGGRI